MLSRLPILLLCLGLWAGCRSMSPLDAPDAGRTSAYTEGLPDFDLEAIGTIQDGAPGIDLYIGIPHASIVFRQAGERFVGRFDLDVRLLDREGRHPFGTFLLTDTLRVSTYDETQSYRAHPLAHRFSAAPGTYLIEATVRDRTSGAIARRRLRLDVPAPDGTPTLSRVRLEGRIPGEPFRPLVSLHLPAGLDTLHAVAELFNVPDGADFDVRMHLVRFQADASVAIPPYGFSTAGSLAYRGIRFDRADTLQRSRQTLLDVAPEVRIEFDLPPLDEGVYGVALEAVGPGAPEGTRQSRLISIKSETFPAIVTIEEMSEALGYLLTSREQRAFHEARTPAAKKALFDRFWGDVASNRQRAANLVKLYFSRVEAANRYFTTHKAGWKTDRGMVYVVLGPPVSTERRLDSETWYYSYNEANQHTAFTFRQVRGFEGDNFLENYVLQRGGHYHQIWEWAIEQWRSGEAM